ncbi:MULTISPECIES: TniQ family protein [Sphingomonas]|uniref:TniQ family protein n=1 Tax=Sphingomonas ginsenosidivorax TaxID=862135 RepID=A0A5C6UBV5_9SPHN|nr:TniQ family protein [Sphingomonas ginsenosidivorax]TXC69920.1 TniQ family protein [Sphingomonas ginsenosidivorax]
MPHSSRPWPIRVEPASGEALSSWLTRIGNLHDVSFEQLVQEYFGYSGSWSEINFTSDLNLLQNICRLSRVEFNKVRSMTFDGVVPYAFGDNAGGFEDYVLSQTVLLKSWNDRPRLTRNSLKWRPWGFGDRVRACPRCVGEDCTIALRLDWLVPVSLSCATHQCFLQECVFLPGQYVLWNQTFTGKPTLEMVELDRISGNAFREGIIPDQFITPTRWFRTLRTLVEELIAPGYVHKEKRKLIAELWHEYGDRILRLTGGSFELLQWIDQREVLKVASVGIAHLINTSYQEVLGVEWPIRSAEVKKAAHYLKDALATRVWKNTLADGGYDRAKRDSSYASLLGNILYWHRDSQMERAWMIEIYLQSKGVSSFSANDIRMYKG